jgi:glycosyltransferase involved in cell wall biosynthesis
MPHKPTLRIGIDGTRLDAPFTGINKYIYEICCSLNNISFPANFIVYSRTAVDLPTNPSWQNRVETNPVFAKLPRSIWLKMRCAKYVEQDNIDLFWATSSIFPIFKNNVRVVNTIYDLNHIVAPETMSSFTRLTHNLWIEKDILRADALITISQGSAIKIKKHFGCEVDAIVTPGLSKNYHPVDEKNVNICLQSHGIQAPYILSVATMEPRKNLFRLVQAYRNLRKDKKLNGYSLVLVGLKGWEANMELQKLIQSDESIKTLGYVPEGDLPSLYTGSELFLFPSLYEGFGMPVLEARACSTRVVASDIPELHEAGGENTIYVNPMEYTDIQRGILTALRSPRPVPANLTKKYSWNNSAQKLSKIFLKLSGKYR